MIYYFSLPPYQQYLQHTAIKGPLRSSVKRCKEVAIENYSLNLTTRTDALNGVKLSRQTPTYNVLETQNFNHPIQDITYIFFFFRYSDKKKRNMDTVEFPVFNSD